VCLVGSLAIAPSQWDRINDAAAAAAAAASDVTPEALLAESVRRRRLVGSIWMFTLGALAFCYATLRLQFRQMRVLAEYEAVKARVMRGATAESAAWVDSVLRLLDSGASDASRGASRARKDD
jgi:hypothetical protein